MRLSRQISRFGASRGCARRHRRPSEGAKSAVEEEGERGAKGGGGGVGLARGLHRTPSGKGGESQRAPERCVLPTALGARHTLSRLSLYSLPIFHRCFVCDLCVFLYEDSLLPRRAGGRSSRGHVLMHRPDSRPSDNAPHRCRVTRYVTRDARVTGVYAGTGRRGNAGGRSS